MVVCPDGNRLPDVILKGNAAIVVSVASGIVRVGTEIEVTDIRIEKALGKAGGGRETAWLIKKEFDICPV